MRLWPSDYQRGQERARGIPRPFLLCSHRPRRSGRTRALPYPPSRQGDTTENEAKGQGPGSPAPAWIGLLPAGSQQSAKADLSSGGDPAHRTGSRSAMRKANPKPKGRRAFRCLSHGPYAGYDTFMRFSVHKFVGATSFSDPPCFQCSSILGPPYSIRVLKCTHS